MTTAAKSFTDFGVEPSIDAALADAGITTPFPIQELTLPLALTGADIIGQARTGTGKTLAFGIPLLQRTDPDVPGVQALVIVPTRELCLQVTGDLNQAGVRKGVDVAAVYGGRAIEPQVEALRDGASVVVGTPGRLLDLMRRGNLRLDKVHSLVLDEADEMLDLGFLPDVEQLIEATAADRQTLLFSATMPSQVVALARRYMRKPTFLRADVEEVHIAPETTQYFFSCHRMDKPAVLARILQTPNRGLCVVFSRTKRMADILAEELRGRGIAAAPIHSDLRQEAREKALARFRKGKVDVLVATEVAARGLDITNVTHVVNYDCPDDEKMYLHRIGRTGRAGGAGVAITLAVWNELARLEMIKKALDITSIETHEVFSTSPILDELFDLPPRAPRTPVVVEDEEDDAEAAAPAGAGAAPGEEPGPKRRRRRGGRRRGGGGDARGAQDGAGDGVGVVAQPEVAEALVAADPEPDADAALGADGATGAPAGSRPRFRIRERLTRRGHAAETGDTAADAAATERQAAEEAPAGADALPSRADGAEAAGLRETAAGVAEGERGKAAGADAAGGDTPSADTAGQGPEGTGAEEDRRVRVRRRTRRGPGAGGQSGDGQSGAVTGTGDRGTPRARAAGNGRGDRDGEAQPRERRESTRSGPQRGVAGKTRAAQGSGSSRRSQTSRARRQPERARPRRVTAERTDAATARGGGKPTLSRPLRIAHLP